MIIPASGHQVRLFMWTKILCMGYFFIYLFIFFFFLGGGGGGGGVPTIDSTFEVANMVKTATVKDVPISNDALLNIQACLIYLWENGICSPIW